MSTLLASPEPDFMYMSASAPDAPPLSETTIGCFIRLFFCTAACSMRAIWSDAPPAPAATTISTAFVGSHASAGAAAKSASAVPAPRRNAFDRLIIVLLSLASSRRSQARGRRRLLCYALCGHFASLYPPFKRIRRPKRGPRQRGHRVPE